MIDAAGCIVCDSREAYPLICGGDGVQVEQDPEVLWQAVRRAIGTLLTSRASAGEAAAISFSSQMSTHMLVDGNSRPLTRFISWADQRASLESRELSAAFSPQQMAVELGATLPSAASWPLPKLAWWRAHEPALLDKARFLVQPKDWIIWKLCGIWISDLSSLRGLRHQESGAVSPVLAQWAGSNPDLALPFADPDSIIGTVAAPLARELGLPENLPVVLGWNDLAAAVLGATGLPGCPMGFDITGTSEHLGVSFPNACATPSAPLYDIPIGPAHRLRYGVTSSSGRSLQWYWEQFREQPANAEGYRQLEAEIELTPYGADNLLFLPYLNGERAPWFNPQARGVFYGITASHKPAHFSRAVLEGIAFTLRSIQIRLGVEAMPREVRVAGGGSAMAAWNQMKADTLRVPFSTLECPEAGCLGAAILAAKALGWHPSLESAGRAMIRTAQTFEPNPAHAALYERQHVLFEKLYHALEPVFADAAT